MMGRRRAGRRAGRARAAEPPLPLAPVDLLAGLAPGVELAADDVPAGIAPRRTARSASTTVAEVGRLLRTGDGTIRRLIRTTVVRPRERRRAAEIDRPGVLPRTRRRPGE